MDFLAGLENVSLHKYISIIIFERYYKVILTVKKWLDVSEHTLNRSLVTSVQLYKIIVMLIHVVDVDIM